MNTRFKQFYINIAKETAQLSRAERLKVGAIIVKNNNIIAFGFNGTPSGWINKCERETEDGLITVPEVIHAEMNCLYKLAKSNESGEGAAMFISHNPCFECSKGIFMAGISEVYYRKDYRCKKGLDFLKKCGIFTCKL